MPPEPPPAAGQPECPQQQPQPPSSVQSAMAASGFPGRLSSVRLDMDTMIVLAIAWFLLSENGEIDWEQFITIGVLCALGL